MLDNREMSRHYAGRSRIPSSRKGEKRKNTPKNLLSGREAREKKKILDLTRRGESNVLA